MTPRPPKLTRRRFLAASAAAIAGTVGYARFVEPHWAEVVRRPLPVEHLPPALDGGTLVQLSDLHVGLVDPGYLSSWMRAVGDLRPDITVVTGDFVHRGTTAELDEATRVLAHLAPAQLGTFGILGNHDYGPSWQDVVIGEKVSARLAGLGVRLLRNETVDVSGLQLFGLDDLWSRRFDLARVMATLDRDRAAVGLCHNPDGLDRDGWAGFRGWVLAGHTHGGQCKLPFLDPPILPVENKRYTAGHIDLGDGRHVYINRGIGHGRCVRFNVRPEVAAFTLRPA